MGFRSGFVSIVGRPNAGKSTLLNALLGQKLAIVTHKPQTTRTRVLGVLEMPAAGGAKAKAGAEADRLGTTVEGATATASAEADPFGMTKKEPKGKSKEKGKGKAQPGGAQIVLVDTPGIHKPDTQLDKRMMQEVQEALEQRDVVLFMVDVTHRLARTEGEGKVTGRMALSAAEDEFSLQLIEKLGTHGKACPVILLLNKVDQISQAEVMPLIAHWAGLYKFAEIIPISARKNINLDLLLEKVVGVLPEGKRYFPKDQLTDQPERFLVAELIREKILMLTGEEVPYSSAVVIEKYEEPASMKKLKDGRLPVTKIAAAVFCERTGQKAILIGKQGAMLKEIGSQARKDIESLLGTRVFLELFVKVQEDWRSKAGFVEDLDWRRQLEALAEKQAGEE